MNYLKGNKIIAKFMGWRHMTLVDRQTKLKYWVKNPSKLLIKHKHIDLGYYDELNLSNELKLYDDIDGVCPQFHNSYDLLFEVTDKMESIGVVSSLMSYVPSDILPGFFERYIYEVSYKKYNELSGGNTRKETIWDGCVSFIKYYNERNENIKRKTDDISDNKK